MKKLTTIVMTAVFLSGGTLLAQEAPEPRFERMGEFIKGTFYYEDGSVKQEGTYKKGKLHGEWISYDQDGQKETIARYTAGKKTGKWFFWNDNQLTEVDYDDNRIARVNSWKSDGILVDNE